MNIDITIILSALGILLGVWTIMYTFLRNFKADIKLEMQEFKREMNEFKAEMKVVRENERLMNMRLDGLYKILIERK